MTLLGFASGYRLGGKLFLQCFRGEKRNEEKVLFATLDLSLSIFVLRNRDTQEPNHINQGRAAAKTNIPQAFMAHYNRSLYPGDIKSNVDISGVFLT